MDNKISKIRFAQDTTANWELVNPILAKGEPALELNSEGEVIAFKIGDGIHDWKHLGAQSGDYQQLAQQVIKNTDDISTNAGDISGLKTSVGALEQAEGLNESAISNLNTEINGENGIDYRLETVETTLARKLPAVPNAEGTYTLKCAVDSEGNLTYTWVSEEL